MVNQRKATYGGSLGNRTRLSLQVIQAVPEAVGSDFILGVRATGDELIKGGLSVDECAELVAKLARGDEHHIRPCVGLGYCVDRVDQGRDALCGHNAATGREAKMPHIIRAAEVQKKVVIVGGRPGGLEAARICAKRGHHTIVFEASDRLGGQLNLASRGQTRRQIAGVAAWLVHEVDLLGVDVRLNHYAEAADVIGGEPDLVVVATGGWPNEVEVPGRFCCSRARFFTDGRDLS